MSNEEIQLLRDKIDAIDNRLLELINERLVLAKKIGVIKGSKGVQVTDRTRESQILDRLAAHNKGPLTETVLRHIFSNLIASSRELQKPQKVAYLGPEATFTHIAALNHFGHAVSLYPLASIGDVFSEVEKGGYHYGVVPVENSIEGAVTNTLDLFFESNLNILAEEYQPISHDLLSRNDRMEDIKVVYSHPQAFAQCRQWLRKHLPDAVLSECSSTAYAALKASEQPNAAAIASSNAAYMYSLKVVHSKIEDYVRNITRFLVIGKDKVLPTGHDKTTIMFATSHTPGALYRILEPIATANLNMMKLESRPTKHENWNYFFFVDLAGHIEDPIISETVDKMKQICLFLKFLGSYPNAQD